MKTYYRPLPLFLLLVLMFSACTTGPRVTEDLHVESKSPENTPTTQPQIKQAVSMTETEVVQEQLPRLDAITPPPQTTAAQREEKAVRLTQHSQALPASEPAFIKSFSKSKAGLMNDIRRPSAPVNRENYAHFDNNPVKKVNEQPVSTFSIDVDTGSYSNIRRLLNQGQLPVKDAVRVEEMLNYFSYDYPASQRLEQPFAVTTEIGPTPWNSDTQLLLIGIKGFEVAKAELPAANLVFLVDVSGSMQSPDKLGLVKTSLKLLVNQMRKQDRMSLVVYAGAAGVVLEPTPGDQKARILNAIDALEAGGSTNGGEGIRAAYRLAEQAFIQQGVNRILLASDGDFNVGMVSHEALINLVEEKRKTGVAFTTLGFGTGNYNDQLAEQLANKGNGQYAYIDSLLEAQKVLVNEMSSTLLTIAKDVKIQLEFNPGVVAEYRLIGYVNRLLNREDFNNDNIDAGELGAGHSVTALYEITLVGGEKPRIDPLRYQTQQAKEDVNQNEVAFLKLRYKQPNANASQLMTFPIAVSSVKQALAQTSERFRFAGSVASFGQLLRGGEYMEHFGYHDVIQLANASKGNDTLGLRGDFVRLVSLAQALSESAAAQ